MTAFPVFSINQLAGCKEHDIHVCKLKDLISKNARLKFPHKYDFYHIALFTGGSGSHAIDNKWGSVRPYKLYFIAPGQVHNIDFNENTDGYAINFSAALFQSFLINPSYLKNFFYLGGNIENAEIDLDDRIRKEVVSLFTKIQEESEKSDKLCNDMIKVLILQTFILISRTAEPLTQKLQTPSNYPVLKRFLELVDKNVSVLKLPKEYARQLFVTPHYLNAICTEMLGKSTGEIIRNRVIIEAKRMILNLDLSISDISFRLSFKDNSYFSKFFKKYAGITPEAFRRSATNNASLGINFA